MKILVTGANGYLGQGVVKRFLDMEIHVVATDLTVESIDKRAEVIAADLFTVESPFEFFGSPDILVHMAWRDGFTHNAQSHLTDLSSHMNFLEKMFNSNIKKIAVMGSMHEVGFFEGSIDETTPTNPANFYGVSKDALRNYILLKSELTGISVEWLRAFYIVGNTDKGSSIFSKIVQSENNGSEKFPFTTGKNQFDFLDYDEFVKRVVLSVLQNEVSGIINICSGEPVRLSDRVEQFIIENGFKIKLNYGAYPDRKYDSKAVWGNSEKIDHILKNSKINLRDEE